MGTPTAGLRIDARLLEVRIADEPSSWAGAGFAVTDDIVHIGLVAFRLTGCVEGGPRGITGWTLAGLSIADGVLDGLPTENAASNPSPTGEPGEPVVHPNGVVGLDHVVVLTPDLERTIAACEAAGLDLRRIRETESNGSPMRQAFFRLGPVVLEVVSGDIDSGVPAAEAPATFFGLAVDVEDLDVTARFLGEGLGRTKEAVQRSRRIATLRHRHFDLSVPLAAMDLHGGR